MIARYFALVVSLVLVLAMPVRAQEAADAEPVMASETSDSAGGLDDDGG